MKNAELLINKENYKDNREKYKYISSDCNFNITQTGSLKLTGEYHGIFAKEVPDTFQKGINLRKFELIVQEVFKDTSQAVDKEMLTETHIENMKQIAGAIIYWKMASQGGRSKIKRDNMLNKWQHETTYQLIAAYKQKEMVLFKIGGVRIPTATAFMRFLFPDDYGIMDSRVVKNYTQPQCITTLSLREKDSYINDVKENIMKYDNEYCVFLRNQVRILNEQEILFEDNDEAGNKKLFAFRTCDIEMALF